MGGSNSFDNATSANVSLVTDNNKAGFYAYGQSRYRQAYDHDGDGYSELPLLRNQTIGVNSYLKLSPYSKLRTIIDLISGMTDRYAVSMYQKLSGQRL